MKNIIKKIITVLLLVAFSGTSAYAMQGGGNDDRNVRWRDYSHYFGRQGTIVSVLQQSVRSDVAVLGDAFYSVFRMCGIASYQPAVVADPTTGFEAVDAVVNVSSEELHDNFKKHINTDSDLLLFFAAIAADLLLVKSKFDESIAVWQAFEPGHGDCVRMAYLACVVQVCDEIEQLLDGKPSVLATRLEEWFARPERAAQWFDAFIQENEAALTTVHHNYPQFFAAGLRDRFELICRSDALSRIQKKARDEGTSLVGSFCAFRKKFFHTFRTGERKDKVIHVYTRISLTAIRTIALREFLLTFFSQLSDLYFGGQDEFYPDFSFVLFGDEIDALTVLTRGAVRHRRALEQNLLQVEEPDVTQERLSFLFSRRALRDRLSRSFISDEAVATSGPVRVVNVHEMEEEPSYVFVARRLEVWHTPSFQPYLPMLRAFITMRHELLQAGVVTIDTQGQLIGFVLNNFAEMCEQLGITEYLASM